MTQAARRAYHYIYKTTCIITERYYIGMHSTDDIDDGYIGSGTRLWHSIKKYGKENHKCEILEFLPDRKSLRNKEIEIINEELIRDPQCMNIMKGGDGNWDHVNKNGKGYWSGMAGNMPQHFCDAISKGRMGIKLSEEHKQHLSECQRGEKNHWYGKHHTDETKQKIGEANAKLSTIDVGMIRGLFYTGSRTRQQLADEYNVSYSAIKNIILGVRRKQTKEQLIDAILSRISANAAHSADYFQVTQSHLKNVAVVRLKWKEKLDKLSLSDLQEFIVQNFSMTLTD